MKRYKKYKVYLFTSERYCAGVVDPVANPVKVVTNLPNTKSIKGSRVPAPIAAMNEMMLSAQLLRSAYLKIRCYGLDYFQEL